MSLPMQGKPNPPWWAGIVPRLLPPYTGSTIKSIQNVPNVIGGAAGAITGTGQFLTDLTNKNTWTRVGEFLFGGILVFVGLNAMAHNPAGKTADAVAGAKSMKGFRG